MFPNITIHGPKPAVFEVHKDAGIDDDYVDVAHTPFVSIRGGLYRVVMKYLPSGLIGIIQGEDIFRVYSERLENGEIIPNDPPLSSFSFIGASQLPAALAKYAEEVARLARLAKEYKAG